MEPRWTVYCHTHVASGRRYVGLTKKTMLFRWNQHVGNARAKRGKGCAHFWAAIRKYGKDAFSHEVLDVCETLEAANAAEERWIEELGTRDPEKGFNLMKGGAHTPHSLKNPWDRPEYRKKQMERTCPLTDQVVRAAALSSMKTPESVARRSNSSRIAMTPEVREKISLRASISNSNPAVREKISRSLTGRTLSSEHRLKIGSAFKGKTHSLESRSKMSSALKGKRLSPGHRLAISDGQKGRTLSAETRAKISAALKAGRRGPSLDD